MKLLIAVTGASGTKLGVRFVDYLPESVEAHLICSENALIANRIERKDKPEIYSDDDIAAAVSSGSYGMDAMAIIPCSMNTLAKISCGIADNLTTRAASVAIKEGKRVLIAPREMPFSAIALENMLKLSRLGVIISPPVMGYYSSSETIEDMERFVIGKWYDVLGIENSLYPRWEGQ